MNHTANNHPQHPVRDAFYCVWCFFFALAFNHLWVCSLFEFEYEGLAFLIAVLILVAALIGATVSFKKSHGNYFRYRRNLKHNRHNGNRHGNDRKRYNGNRYGNDRKRYGRI